MSEQDDRRVPSADIEQLLDALLALDTAGRAEKIAELARAQPAMAAELRQWLAGIEQSEGFLETAYDESQGVRHAGLLVGAWRLSSLIGRGGMGEVWLAQRADGAFDKHVAIKFIRSDTPALRDRLARERRILARLEHPGIARLLDGGLTADGHPYLVTEFIDGMPLDRWVADQRPSVEERLDVFCQTAAAVAFAHVNLIVHRDLKPANVIVDGQRCVRLLDFGICKLLDDAADTQTADRAMTPQFAAPEQLTGAPITTRTDVYALGALLYWLLTGKPPLETRELSLAALVRCVCEEMPPPPSSICSLRGPIPPIDIDAITLKALAKEPMDRYASVDALLADLRRAREHRPISARYPTVGYRARKYVRRHRVIIAFAGIVIVALAVGLIGTLWQARIAAHERDIARAERDSAQLEVQRSDAAHDFVRRLFSRTGQPGERTTIGELLDKAGEAIERESPGVRDQSRVELGELQFLRGNFKSAEKAFERIDFAASTLPLQASVHAQCRLALAKLELGEHAIADDLANAGLRRGEALLGNARLAALPCRFERATALEFAGDIAAAIVYDRATMQWLDATTDAPPDLLAEAYDHTGRMLSQAGRFIESAAAFRQTIAQYQRAGRPQCEEVARALGNIALAQMRAGLPHDARGTFDEAIAMHKRVEGPSTWLAEQLIHYSQLLDTLGEPAAAAKALNQAQQMQDPSLAPSSNQQILLLWQRARVLAQLGDREAALATVQTMRKMVSANFAADSYFFDFVEQVHAMVYYFTARSQNDLEQAREGTDRAIAGMRGNKTSARLLPDALVTSSAIAYKQNRFADSLARAREARTIYEQRLDPAGWQLAQCDTLAGGSLVHLGKSAEGMPLLISAVPRLRAQLGENHALVRAAQQRLSELQNDPTYADAHPP